MLPTPENLKRKREIIDTLKTRLVESLDLHYTPQDLHEDTPLIGAGLGLDSLDILEIVMCVESSFKVKVPQYGAEILRTFNTIADFVSEEQDRQNAQSIS